MSDPARIARLERLLAQSRAKNTVLENQIATLTRYRPQQIPDAAHPLVKVLLREMNTQRISAIDLCDKAGINKNTFKDWRYRTVPTLDNFEACLNVVGLTLAVAREKET